VTETACQLTGKFGTWFAAIRKRGHHEKPLQEVRSLWAMAGDKLRWSVFMHLLLAPVAKKEVTQMKGMLKAVVHDMDFNELRIALLAIIAWVNDGTPLVYKDLEEIIDEAKRS